MIHPVFKSSNGRLIFIAVWIALMVVQTVILSLFYSLPIFIALTDSILWNLLFAFLSLGLWFWVRITDIETAKPLSIAINHFGAAAFSIIAIVSLHKFVLGQIFPLEANYLQFMEASLPGRMITGVLLYILISLTFYLFFYIHNFREKVSREAELKALIKDAELNWLKLQVNPHFLFNSLNSINALAISAPEKAQEMITRLSELLRYSLKQTPDSLVPLQDEVDNCIKYLEIEKVRFGKRLIYTIDANSDFMSAKVPSMILQPLFENAIKHSVAQSAEVSYVKAYVTKENLGIKISVCNTLTPNPPSTSGTKVGLENIKRRLSLFFGMNNLLTVVKTENDFCVSILIPQ
jgi:two-component system, LytTR family, sensor kinase